MRALVFDGQASLRDEYPRPSLAKGEALVRVVAIGPECTGKTWLSQQLAAHYRCRWSAEYAREFVERSGRPVVVADVEAIGRGQLVNEERAIDSARGGGGRLVVHDTDLVSTRIYSEHYFGECPAWIGDAGLARLPALYLLHEIDVPWTGDGDQREEPERRGELRERFRVAVVQSGAAWAVIEGGGEERRRRAIEAVDRRLR